MRLDIPAASFLPVPLLDLALFALFIGVAILRRRVLQTHERLMLVGTISTSGTAVVRLPLSFMVGPLDFLLDTHLFPLPLVFGTRRDVARASSTNALAPHVHSVRV